MEYVTNNDFRALEPISEWKRTKIPAFMKLIF